MKPHRSTQSPAALGYTFPAEFAPQCATWFSWPRPEGISFPGRYHTIARDLAGIIREVAIRQDVHINVMNDNWQQFVLNNLRERRPHPASAGQAAGLLPRSRPTVLVPRPWPGVRPQGSSTAIVD
jgi:hypothetical protein